MQIRNLDKSADKAKYLQQFMSPQKYGPVHPHEGGSIRDKANLILNRNQYQYHRTERKQNTRNQIPSQRNQFDQLTNSNPMISNLNAGQPLDTSNSRRVFEQFNLNSDQYGSTQNLQRNSSSDIQASYLNHISRDQLQSPERRTQPQQYGSPERSSVKIREQQTAWRSYGRTDVADQQFTPETVDRRKRQQSMGESPDCRVAANAAILLNQTPKVQFRDFSPVNLDQSPSPVRQLRNNFQNQTLLENVGFHAQQKANQVLSKETILKQKEYHQKVEQIACLKNQSQLDLTIKNFDKVLKMEQKTFFEVYMRCVTWTRDSHGLFDYESKNIAKKNIKTQTGGKIIRIGDEVQLVSKSYVMGPNSKPMVSLNKNPNNKGHFVIVNETILPQNNFADVDTNQKMFVVVRNTKSTSNNQDYELSQGDIVKIGRIKFKIRHFVNPHESNNQIDFYPDLKEEANETERNEVDIEIQDIEINSNVSKRETNDACMNKQCKVCWSSEQTFENPLLNSCMCDGSVRYIHYKCLKQWLQQKMTSRESKLDQGGTVMTLTWKTFECELCKQPYPFTFQNKEKQYRLIDYIDEHLPKNRNHPYILMESLTFEKNSSRIVQIVKPCPVNQEIQVFKMGRGHESEVRVCDISVSRCHALLKYKAEKGMFYLEDNLSKFGTLVIPKLSQINLEPELTKAVQIGRSVISFTIKEVPVKIEQPEVPKAVLEPQFLDNSQEKIVKNDQIADHDLNQKSVDEVEAELKKKIEMTNLKIQQLMKNQAEQMQRLQTQKQQRPIAIQQDQKDEKEIEEFLIEAANNLIQAKKQFEKAKEIGSSKKQDREEESKINQMDINSTIKVYPKRFRHSESKKFDQSQSQTNLGRNQLVAGYESVSEQKDYKYRGHTQVMKQNNVGSYRDQMIYNDNEDTFDKNHLSTSVSKFMGLSNFQKFQIDELIEPSNQTVSHSNMNQGPSQYSEFQPSSISHTMSNAQNHQARHLADHSGKKSYDPNQGYRSPIGNRQNSYAYLKQEIHNKYRQYQQQSKIENQYSKYS